MDRRRFLVSSLAGALASPQSALAQTRKTFTLGVLYPGALDERRLSAIRQGLSEGFGDDRRVVFQARSADGHAERLATMAAELVGASVGVIFAIAPAAISAVRATATRIPIVALDLETDPVAAGWIQSIARPGGNLTGIFFDAPEVAGKWIQLIRESVPARSRIAVLWDPATGPAQALAAEQAARMMFPE